MLKTVPRRILSLVISTTLLVGTATSYGIAQSSVQFPAASQTPFPGSSFGLQENAGLAAQTFNGNLFVWFRGDSTDSLGRAYMCGVEYNSTMSCSQDGMPISSGPGQLTVFKGLLYMAYAYSGTHQLVVCSSNTGLAFSCSLIANVYVADSPAIAVTPDGNELDIAYQENNSDHYLGVAYSTDGATFTNKLSSTYKIGHTPAMTAFNGKLVIAAFCQCDSHYLDVYTSSGSGQISFLTENKANTLANASPPSLVVANNVLVLGYIQNGSRYFQITTSYNGSTWTTPVRQTNLVSPWAGPALAVYQNQLWLFYNPQGTSLGARQLASSSTSLPY